MAVGLVDWVVIALTLVISLAVGIYYRFTGGRQRTIKEFLLADKKGSIIPVSLSVMATFLPATVLLGAPSEAYAFGTQYIMCCVGRILSVPFTAFIILPVFFDMQLISPFEYLEKRFGYLTRCVASLLSCLIALISSGISLFVPTLAVEALTKMSPVQSMLILIILCTVYSSVGGLKGVIITDVFQSILMFATVIAMIIFAITDKGFYTIWNTAEKRGRIEFFQFDLDPSVRHTFWNLIIGGAVSYASNSTVCEAYIQRYMSLRKPSQAAWSMLFGSVLILLIAALYIFVGLAIFSEYSDCDPVTSGRISKYDEVVPTYLMDKMAHIPGVIGLFVSGVIAASLSSISSHVNSTAAIVVEDYIKPFYRYKLEKECPESHAILYAKTVSVFAGIISIIIALLVRQTTSILQLSFTLQNAIVGPLFGLFALGMFVPFANGKGALSGLLIGSLLIMWTFLGEPRPPLQRLPMSIEGCNISNNKSEFFITYRNKSPTPNLNEPKADYFFMYKISYMWYSTLGFCPCFIAGVVVSYLTAKFEKTSKTNMEMYPPTLGERLKKYGYKQASATDTENTQNNCEDR